MINQRLRLVSFLLVSLAVHAVALSSWRGERVARDEPSLGEPQLAVLFAEGARAGEEEGPSPEKGTNRRTRTARAADRSAASQSDAPRPASVDRERVPHTRNALLGEVRTRLSRYLDYPSLARHRGWQGEVLLGFTVEPDGRLSHIRIARSSGYDILDASALESLRKVRRLTAQELQLAVRVPDLLLPVIYRLTEN